MKLKTSSRFDKSYFFSIAVIFILMGIIVWFDLYKNSYFIDSDSSSDLLYAKFLASNHTWISTDWYFTTEIRLIYTQLLTAPLFSIINNWTVIRAISDIVFNLLMVLSYCYMMRGINLQYKWIWFTAPLLILPTSLVYLNMVTFDLAYTPYIIIGFFYMGLFFRITHLKKDYKTIYKVILYILYIFFSFYLGLQGLRYLLSITFPLFLAGIWMVCKSEEFGIVRRDINKKTWVEFYKSSSFKSFLYCFSGVILAGFGYLINSKILSQIFSYFTFSKMNYQLFNGSSIFERLSWMFGDLLKYFGYIGDKSPFSLGSITNIISIFLIILITIFTIKIFKRKNRCENGQQSIIIFFVTSLIFNLFIFLFLYYDSYRYYIPILVFYVPIFAIYFNMKPFKLNLILTAIFVYVSVFSLSIATFKRTLDVNQNESRISSIQYLINNNYNFGYATFWNANITTELTNGKIEMAEVSDFNTMSPYHWGTPKDYYLPEYHNGKTFILMTEEEKAKFINSPIIKEGKLAFEDNNYAVYTFDSDTNIEKKIVENNK